MFVYLFETISSLLFLHKRLLKINNIKIYFKLLYTKIFPDKIITVYVTYHYCLKQQQQQQQNRLLFCVNNIVAAGAWLSTSL